MFWTKKKPKREVVCKDCAFYQYVEHRNGMMDRCLHPAHALQAPTDRVRDPGKNGPGYCWLENMEGKCREFTAKEG